MAARNSQQVSTKGYAWGKLRVELGLSMRDLSERSGISKPVLSQVESGRMVPTGDEFIKVIAVLWDLQERRSLEQLRQTALWAVDGVPPAPPAAPNLIESESSQAG